MVEKKFNALKAVLVFNAEAGNADESPRQLVGILNELQSLNIQPRVVLIGPDQPVEELVQKGIDEGAKLVVVAGGDGTIESITPIFIKNKVRLGIIPAGTRNNLALNLGIPADIPSAVRLLRHGKSLQIDIGEVSSGNKKSLFIEVATLGLLADLHPHADDIQHGDLTKIGEFLSTLVSSTPSKIKMKINDGKTVEAEAYMLLIANMPYLGPNMKIDPKVSFRDKLLDVFFFSDMGKLNLLSYAIRSLNGSPEDQSLEHYKVSQVEIETDPQMALRVDGAPLDAQQITVRVLPKAITVMAGSTRGLGPDKSKVAQLKEAAQ
ncbi:MAG TPA: YegS/Rv2252/BmrU family lipid kinase [Terriglobales bacterium]|nr:YegS/Rv2252/BmrU family lipid kinase [Terriglobales bacterium]